MATVSVTQPWTYALELPRDPSAPAIARAMLRAVLRERGVEELVDDAQTLAADLIVGAPVRGGDTLRLRLQGYGRGRLRMTVGGHVVELPEPEPYAASSAIPIGCETCVALEVALQKAEARCAGGEDAVHAGIALRRHFRNTHWLPECAAG
ncbi:hypothetical protein AB0G83_09600 [Streptomyces klenkii]|uniref:hypothetical protein n=1 Tax=Streptomyces klenkii TaxID=1420899 RepID=UPI0033D518D2